MISLIIILTAYYATLQALGDRDSICDNKCVKAGHDFGLFDGYWGCQCYYDTDNTLRDIIKPNISFDFNN